MSIFSVNKIFFTVLGYPMSYIELSVKKRKPSMAEKCRSLLMTFGRLRF